MFELPVDFMLDSNIELYPPSITSIDGEDGRRTFLYKSKSGNCGIFFVDGDKLTYVDRMIDAAIFNGWESNSILYCAGMTLRDRSDTGFGKPTIFCFDEQQGTAEQYEFPLEYDGRLSAAIEQQCKDLMLEKPALVPEAWVASASLKNNRLLVLALNEKAGGWFAEDPDPFVLHSDHIAIALYKFSESREIEFIAAFVPFLFWDKVETEDYIYFYMHRHRGGERPVNEMTYVEMDKASEEIKVGKVSIDNLSPVDILLTFRADYQNGFGFFAAADVVRLTFSGKVTIYLRSDNGKDWIAQQSRQQGTRFPTSGLPFSDFEIEC